MPKMLCYNNSAGVQQRFGRGYGETLTEVLQSWSNSNPRCTLREFIDFKAETYRGQPFYLEHIFDAEVPTTTVVNVPDSDYNAKKLVIATEGFSVSIDEIRELRALQNTVTSILECDGVDGESIFDCVERLENVNATQSLVIDGHTTSLRNACSYVNQLRKAYEAKDHTEVRHCLGHVEFELKPYADNEINNA